MGVFEIDHDGEDGFMSLKSQGEIEAAACHAVARFQIEFLGRGPRRIHAHLIENRLFVHLQGVLSMAEQRLAAADHDGGDPRGRELLRQFRSQLVASGRPLLETLVGDAVGAQPVGLHHDINPSGEEVLVVTLANAPTCRTVRRRP